MLSSTHIDTVFIGANGYLIRQVCDHDAIMSTHSQFFGYRNGSRITTKSTTS